ncbi:MAG TPA: hypothetical protein VIV88_00150 [Gemmatimonadales bacterium]|jgi:hypothetical protein
MKWGRLVVNVNCALRRGAWYRVARIRSLEAILDVNRKPLVVPNYLVQIVSQPPRRWSVVPRPKRARELPPEWGAHYAVCPSCRERAALLGRPRRLECVRCHGEFDVAWDEGYLHEA